MAAPTLSWEGSATPQYVAVFYPWGAFPWPYSAASASLWPPPTGQHEMGDIAELGSSPPSPSHFLQEASDHAQLRHSEAEASRVQPPSKTYQRRQRRSRAVRSTLAEGGTEVAGLLEGAVSPGLDFSKAKQEEESLDAPRIKELVDASKDRIGGLEAAQLLRKQALRSSSSSRALQSFLVQANYEDAAQVASAFRGHVRQACQSQHANYLIQKIIQVTPAKMGIFIAEELVGERQGNAAGNARHKFGCRVLCRLIEHWRDDGGSVGDRPWPVTILIEEILKDAVGLCRHSYGNFVLQHLLEHGHSEHKHVIFLACSAELEANAKDKHACHVIEKALEECCEDDRLAITSKLVASPNLVFQLCEDQYGSYVVRKVLDQQRSQHSTVVEDYVRQFASGRYSKFWKRALEEYQEAAAAAA